MRYRSAAYASYVLARAGKADISDLRYVHDTLLDTIVSPLAKAHIGAALVLVGDRSRGLNALKAARNNIGYENTGNYYQTSLRDVAGVLSLLADVQSAPGLDQVSQDFERLMKEPNALHTQEKAFVLLATQSLLKRAGPISLARNGTTVDGNKSTQRFNLTPDDLDAETIFSNEGEGPVFASVTSYGAPSTPPAAYSEGFDVSKRFATRDGRPVDLSAVKQNDRIVVILNGNPTGNRLHPAVIADLLPAGFEIEAILKPADGAGQRQSGPYKWMGRISQPKIAEARDDRFVAAIDLYREAFTLAYIVRAVSPGKFAVPGVVVEDMYRPGVFARTETSTLIVEASQ